jgi:DNA polymerase I-like protein with 3'-5' exonuclease and polymerase domains
MLALDEVIDWVECRMLLQVHDSIVFEIAIGREDYWLPIIRRVMENVSAFHPQFGKIPFPVDIREYGLAA